MNRIGAFFLAPLPAAAIGASVSWASGGWPRLDTLFVGYTLVIYAAQLLFGLAIAALLLRKGRGSPGGFALGGALMIALPAVPYLFWSVDRNPHQQALAPTLLALWLLMGALTGLTAWCLIRREAKPSPLSGDAGLRDTFE